MKYKIFSVIFFIIFALNLFAAGHSRAAEGIKISPVKYEELADPGSSLSRTIKVTNDSDTPKTLYPYMKDFSADGEDGTARLIEPGTGDQSSLASWIKIDTKGVSFGAHEEKEIPFAIDIPPTAGPGGYYGALVWGTQAPKVKFGDEEKGAAIAIAQQTGALVLLQVAGEVYEEANVREFTTDKELYSTPFEVNFLMRIENMGNVHVKPRGTIEIKNMFGKETNVIRINDRAANILPKSIRKFDGSWKGDLGFGRYKATLAMTYGTAADQGGQGMQTMFQEKYFWIMPWKIIIPGLLGITFLGALMVLFLKFYKSRAVKKAIEDMGLARVKYVKKFEGPSPTIHFGLAVGAVLIFLFLAVGSAYFLFFA